MKLPPFLHLLALTLAVSASTLLAVEEPPKDKPAETAPAPEKVFAPNALEELRTVLGKPVIVEGTIAASGESKSKVVRYLNFSKSRDSVALVFFVSKGGESYSLEKLNEWVGKKVRVTGKLADYNGTLQIEIEKWEQVNEVPVE